MKKFTFPAVALFLFVFITQNLQAQSPKYCLIEEFTQASCPPCATQNPGFEANILDPNPGTVRQISYHTSWPGIDPMYNFNEAQVDNRVDYYGITYVPDAMIEGNALHAQPGAIVQDNVDAVTSQTSPIKIKVTDVDNGTDHDVTVTVTTTDTPPVGSNFVLRTVIVERDVTYINPPGTNGETYFPNVFRKMLPGDDGDPITLPTVGNSVTFSYTYTEDAIWDMEEIGLIAFVQDETSKEIINCGATFDQSATISDPTALTQAGTDGNISTFELTCGNIGDVTSDYSYTLTSDAPADWSADFTVNGITYSGSATITLDAGTSVPVTINVTPGPTPAWASFTLTIASLTNPHEVTIFKSVYVISGVTELVVNNATMDPSTVTDIEGIYNDAFTNAGTNSYAFLNFSLATKASSEGSLAGVKNIYYNAGWFFPAFTDDYVTQLMNFMDNGGNLFITGQDIGWDVWTDPIDLGHATPLSQDFYNNYMFANWIDDGGTSNKPLTANVDDGIFGSLGSITINYYYGSTYFYPDQIEPIGDGTTIFYYNNNTSKIGGVRGDNGTFKTVYIAPGIEMLGTSVNKNAIIKTAYDWFYGATSATSVQSDGPALGQNFPNPSDGFTLIPVSGLKENMTLTVSDQFGRVLLTQPVTKSASTIEVNTEKFSNGIYMYRLVDDGGKGMVKMMEVVH